jgi:Zn-dependent oligopeptidase
MYSAVFKSDPLDPARGDRYRRSILGPGGSREELDSLKVKGVNSSRILRLNNLQEFLGRDPNPDAFVEEIFGKS